MKTFSITAIFLFFLQLSFGQNVIKAEYFIDVDKGFGNNTLLTITPSADTTFSFIADLSSVSKGFHQLYIRTKDSNGKWGHTTRQQIEVSTPATQVIGGEYFFNTDPGFGKANQVVFTQSADGTFSFNIPFTNIPDSVNTLYFRVKDNNNNWSITQLQKDTVVTALPGSNLWSHVETWSTHKIPDANTIVILRHDVIVDINGFCRSLALIAPTAHLTANTNKILTITGH